MKRSKKRKFVKRVRPIDWSNPGLSLQDGLVSPPVARHVARAMLSR